MQSFSVSKKTKSGKEKYNFMQNPATWVELDYFTFCWVKLVTRRGKVAQITKETNYKSRKNIQLLQNSEFRVGLGWMFSVTNWYKTLQPPENKISDKKYNFIQNSVTCVGNAAMKSCTNYKKKTFPAEKKFSFVQNRGFLCCVGLGFIGKTLIRKSHQFRPNEIRDNKNIISKKSSDLGWVVLLCFVLGWVGLS